MFIWIVEIESLCLRENRVSKIKRTAVGKNSNSNSFIFLHSNHEVIIYYLQKNYSKIFISLYPDFNLIAS